MATEESLDDQQDIVEINDVGEVVEDDDHDDMMEGDQSDGGSDAEVLDAMDAVCGFEHGAPVFAIAAFSNLVASGGGDDKAYVWDSTSGQLLKELPGHADSVVSIGFSHDGKYVASGGMDGIVNVSSMESENVIKLQGPNEVIWIRWHPRGNVLLAGSEDGTIWMWSIPSGNCMHVFSGHSESVTCGDFLPDGKYIISASADGSLIIWNPQTGIATFKFNGLDSRFHQAPITCLSLSFDNQMAITGSQDGSIKLLHLTQKKIMASFDSHTDSIEGLCFSSNLNYAVSGSVDGKICIWDLKNLALRNSIQTEVGFIHSNR
jgi:ribosome assembly protein SQT1